MKYELLGVPQSKYKKGITVRIVICAAVAFVAVLLNVLLTVFRTEQTHVAFLSVNILADIIAFCFIFFFVSTQITPRKRLYKLSTQKGTVLKGEAVEISETTQTVNGFECFELTVQSEGVRKVFIVKSSAIPADLIGRVILTVADNIVIEAEVLS